MAFDLQKMLHRKGEFETARLDDFAFRARVRAMRLLAEALGRDPATLVARITEGDDADILDTLVDQGFDRREVSQAYYRARDAAERLLRVKIGDPTRGAPRMKWLALPLLVLPLAAQSEERDYCPARPGLGTPACTIAPGHVSVETGLVDWTRENDPDQRSDTILIGDTVVRVGLSHSVEAQIGWTPFGHNRVRDKLAGGVEVADRAGDALLGLKANLHNPDGSGFSAAVQTFVTVPVGRTPIGAGDWGAGVLVPVTFDLGHKLSLQLTPEIDAAVDEDGRGRHFAESGTIGLGVELSDTVNGTVEFQELRDADPAHKTTQALASVSVAWMPQKRLQLDVGAVAGLDRDAPDAELYLGISRLF